VTRVITKEQARRLIGPGGATVRRMRDTSRAFIKIDNEDLPPLPSSREPCQQLRITGTDAQVAVATALIDEVLTQPMVPMSSISALEKPPRSSSTPCDGQGSATLLVGLANPLDATTPPNLLPPFPRPQGNGLFTNSLLSPLHLPPYAVTPPLPFLHHHNPHTSLLQPQQPPLPTHPPSAAPLPPGFGAFPLLSPCSLSSPFSGMSAAMVAQSPLNSAIPTSSSWPPPGLQTNFMLQNCNAPAIAETAPSSQHPYGALDVLRHALADPCALRVFDEPALHSLFTGNHSAPASSPVLPHQATLAAAPQFAAAPPPNLAGPHGDHLYSVRPAGQPRNTGFGAPYASTAPASASAGQGLYGLGQTPSTHGFFPHSLVSDFAPPSCIPHMPAQNHTSFLSHMLTAHREPSHAAAGAGGPSTKPSETSFQDNLRWW
jgi:hypothetical protein